MTTAAKTRSSNQADNPQFDAKLLKQFFHGIYDACEGVDGAVAVYHTNGSAKPRDPVFIRPDNFDSLVGIAGTRALLGDVYFSVDLIQSEAVQGIRKRKGRGKESEIGAMIAFRADIDAAKPGSAEKGHRYPPRERILESLQAMPLQPSIVVGSGSQGVHAYWLLAEPHEIDSEETRGWLKALSSGWQQLLRRKLGKDEESGPYDLDNTSDLTRVLRPAGTWNHKHGRMVEPILCEPTRRFSADDFEQFLLSDLPEVVTDGDRIAGEHGETIATPDVDPESVIEQARWRLSRLPGAVSGQRGHDRTFHAACILVLGYGLPIDDARPILQEWNATCDPPWMEAELEHKLEDADAKPGPRGCLIAADRTKAKRIIVGTDETRVIDEAVEVLAGCDNIYQRGGRLVQVVKGLDPPRGIARPKEAPRIGVTKFARIRELLAAAADWLRPAGKGELEKCHPPEWVVKAVDARDQWQGIRRLEAVVESPVLRADGTVLQSPGYDPDTGIVFRPNGVFPEIPEHPSRADAVRARDALLEVVEDFPFADDTHRSAWLASVLTPVARYAFAGPAPLFLNDANTRGCGKSLLTDVISIVTADRDMARMSLPRDDEEFRKRITSIAMAGEPLVLIDNIAGSFGSPSLDAALTATSWSDRILGLTAMASNVPLYAVWYATGNNVVLVGDTARRIVHIRLESPLEDPEQRADFHHDDLLGWVRQERPRLAAATLTLLAAYCAAGRPDMKLAPWGSFEGWSALVRQAIGWTGLPDPGETRSQLISQADREAAILRQLIAGWEEIDSARIGMTVAAALRKLADYPNDYETLRSALFELAPPRDGKTLNSRSIGMKLHHIQRRVIGGRFLDRRQTRDGAAIWVVAKGGNTQGTKGTKGTKASQLAGAPARTRVNPEAARNSPLSPSSPRDAGDPNDDCQHPEIDETSTHDGYVNRTCRTCGEWLPCRKAVTA